MKFFQLDSTVAELVLLRIVSLYEFSIFWSIIATNSFPVTKEKSLIFPMKPSLGPNLKPNFLIMWKAAFAVVKNMNSGFQLFRFKSWLCHMLAVWSYLTCLVSLLFSLSAVSDFLQPHGLQHARLSCPSPSPRICSNSYPLSQWWHPAISSSVIPFSSGLQSFPASGSFPMSQLFASGSQNFGASASVLPMNIQGWLSLKLSGLISLQPKELSGVFSNTTVWNFSVPEFY